ncbi:MAG TPA: hypothetical protein DGT21_14415 [Armatimonadetes bacterium]|jgi:hypothetical protein|nr:hypothetical protein [Armatimonadota bacterium]
MDESARSQKPSGLVHFRPGIGAYVGLVLATAALVFIARAVTGGFLEFAGGAWFGDSYWLLIVVELVLCAVAWVHVADSLLRHYSADDAGLTVYRPFGATLRIPWEHVAGYQVHGYGQSFTLSVTGGGRLLVMFDCLGGGGALAGIIQLRAGHRPEKPRL